MNAPCTVVESKCIDEPGLKVALGTAVSSLRRTWAQKEVEAMVTCRERAAQLHLRGVKVVAAEYSFDGTRLSFMFSTETEDKADLKSLRHDMQKLYLPSQVEMRQIGPRDVAKMMGGMGACGLESRCCSKFLTDFSPISIKMAKEQNLPLNPTKISGLCGRLMCCLGYEHKTYKELMKGLPKEGDIIKTAKGSGKVISINALKRAVTVELEDGTLVEVSYK